MRNAVLLLVVVLISGCDKSQITELDKKLLPTASDLADIGCTSTKASDLVYETGGLTYLSKEVSVTYEGADKCGFYLYMEMTELKLAIMGGNSVRTSLSGARIGLKITDIETRAPQLKHKGLMGDYYEAYGESGDYLGFIYASEKDAVSTMAIVIGIEMQHQAVLLETVKKAESRIFNKEMIKATENMQQKTGLSVNKQDINKQGK